MALLVLALTPRMAGRTAKEAGTAAEEKAPAAAIWNEEWKRGRKEEGKEDGKRPLLYAHFLSKNLFLSLQKNPR